MNNSDSFRNRAREEVAYPPSWRPEPGDMLIGTVVGFTSAPAGEYGRCPIALIRAEDAVPVFEVGAKKARDCEPGETVSFWLLHLAAKSQWQDAKPARGERVAVRRVADRPSKVPGHSDYADYRILVDRPEGETLDLSAYLSDPNQTDLPF